MSERIRLGVIGCGAIVQAVHLPALSRIPSIDIVALAEPDEQRRHDASARLPGATAHASWHEVIADRKVDAVLIGLPSGLHAECAVAAFEAGKHVYLEKPIAISLEEADRVWEAWCASGRVGMIGFNYRYSPLYVALRDEIMSGRVGDVVAVRSVFSTTVAQVPAWKRARTTGGGVLLDLGSHHVDLIPYLLRQRVCTVSSTLRSIVSEHDTATVDMTFDGNVISQSLFSLSAVEEDRIEIYGRAGKLTVNRYGSPKVEFRSPLCRTSLTQKARQALEPIAQFPAKVKKVLARGYEPSYAAAFSVFTDAVRGRGTGAPDLADGHRSLAIIDAAERSARSGAVIPLPAIDAHPHVLVPVNAVEVS